MGMPSSVPGSLTAASGYRAYNALKTPLFAKALVTRFYCESIAGNITSQDVVPTEIRECGDQVTFRRAPVAEVFDYVKNQDLEVSSLNSEPIIMTIGRAKYWNLKLDKIDEKQTCNIKEWVRAFIESASQILAQQIDREVLTTLPVKADPFNKGRKAGIKSGAFDLGAMGAPVSLTQNNIITYLTMLSAVLDEQCVPASGRFVVFPVSAKALFYNNPTLASANISGQKTSIVLGGTIPDLMGFQIYFANNMPIYRDEAAANKQAYTIIAGFKQATGFVTQLSEQEVIDKDPRSFSKYWRGLQLYDFMVIKPEMLAVLYATLSITNL